MLDKYEFREEYHEVFSPKFGYHLLLGKNSPKGEDISFFSSVNRFVPITSNDFSGYSGKIKEHKINPRYRYLEVGAGLGGFVEWVTSHQLRFSPRVIVVDPADYVLMKDMLLYVRENVESNSYFKKRIEKLIGRASLILDETRVRLVNKSLSQALKDHPELHEIADVVVDHLGPRFHPYTEATGKKEDKADLSRRIIVLEKKLLKKTGVIYHHTG